MSWGGFEGAVINNDLKTERTRTQHGEMKVARCLKKLCSTYVGRIMHHFLGRSFPTAAGRSVVDMKCSPYRAVKGAYLIFRNLFSRAKAEIVAILIFFYCFLTLYKISVAIFDICSSQHNWIHVQVI